MKPQVVLSLQCELSMAARSHPVPLLAEELAAAGASVCLLISQQVDRKSPVWEKISHGQKNLVIHEVPRWIEQTATLCNRAAKGIRILKETFKHKISFHEAQTRLLYSDRFYSPCSPWKRELDTLRKKFTPDAIISYSASESSASLVDWCASTGIPYWFGETSTGPGIEHLAPPGFWPYRRFKRLWKKMNGIIGHSQSMQEDYRALEFTGTYFFFPHWTRFSYRAVPPIWKPKNSKPYVVASLGRFDPFKGYDTIGHAVRSLRSEGFDVRMRLVGSSEKKLSEFRKKIGDTGWLEVRPYFYTEEELVEFFEGVDIFAIASLYEGPCIALLEAMALGFPCVVSNVGGMPEMVQGAGQVFPAKSSGELTDILRELLLSPSQLKTMSEASRSRYQELANIQKVREKVSELLSLLK